MAIEARKALSPSQAVVLHSDSQLLSKTLTLGWKRKKNQDLWAELDQLAGIYHISWNWVRGHNGHPANEACDTLAQLQKGRNAPAQGRPIPH